MSKFDFQCIADKLTFDEVYDNKLKQVREVLSENDLIGVLNTAGYVNERYYENLSRENELFKKTNSENKTRFTCTCCKNNLTLNHTKERLYYFQHEYKTYATDCRYYSYEYVENKENNSIYERESREHKFAKRFIQQWFASAGINLTSERRIKNGLNRPDLQGMMNEKNIVIEIQRSNINRKKLIQRMDEYSSNFNEYYQLWCIVPPTNDKSLIKSISELKHNDVIAFKGKFKSLSERRLVYYQNKVGFILDLGLDLDIDKIRLLAIQYFEEQSELKGRVFEVNSPTELFCYEYNDSEYNSKNLLLTSKYCYEFDKIIKELNNFNTKKATKIDIYTQLNNNIIQVKTFVTILYQGQEKYSIDSRFTGDFDMVIPYNFHKSFVFHLDKYLGILKDKNIEVPVNVYSNQNILINCFNRFYRNICDKEYIYDFKKRTDGNFHVKEFLFLDSRIKYIINIPYYKKDSIQEKFILEYFFENAYFIKKYLKYLDGANRFKKYATSITDIRYDKFEESLEILECFTDYVGCEFIVTKEEKINQEYNSKYIQYSVIIDDKFEEKYLTNLNKYTYYLEMTCVGSYIDKNNINSDDFHNIYCYKNFEYFMIEKTGSVQGSLINKQQLEQIFLERCTA